jgi:hypothetical protein
MQSASIVSVGFPEVFMKAFVAVVCLILLGASQVRAAGQAAQSAAVPQTATQQAAPPRIAVSVSPPQSTIDPAKEADIRRLLDVVGTKALMTQVMNQMEAGLRPTMTQALPPGDYRAQLVDLFFEKFTSKFSVDALLDLIVPIYDKYLSDDDIKGLIQFYGTPLGQKAISVLPKVTSESQAQGEILGQRIGRESMTEVLSEHPDLATALQAAQQRMPTK